MVPSVKLGHIKDIGYNTDIKFLELSAPAFKKIILSTKYPKNCEQIMTPTCFEYDKYVCFIFFRWIPFSYFTFFLGDYDVCERGGRRYIFYIYIYIIYLLYRYLNSATVASAHINAKGSKKGR